MVVSDMGGNGREYFVYRINIDTKQSKGPIDLCECRGRQCWSPCYVCGYFLNFGEVTVAGKTEDSPLAGTLGFCG